LTIAPNISDLSNLSDLSDLATIYQVSRLPWLDWIERWWPEFKSEFDIKDEMWHYTWQNERLWDEGVCPWNGYVQLHYRVIYWKGKSIYKHEVERANITMNVFIARACLGDCRHHDGRCIITTMEVKFKKMRGEKVDLENEYWLWRNRECL